MLLGSLLGFLIGIAVSYIAVVYVFGGLLRTTARVAFEKERGPGTEEAAAFWAENTCLAHAVLLDRVGNIAGAGILVTASRYLSRAPYEHLTIAKRDRDWLFARYSEYYYQGNLAADHDVFHCHKHGQSRWAGHVECVRCGRKYEAPSADANPAPSLCVCGHRLLPDADARGLPLPSSGAAICKHCYADRPKVRQVEPPSPEDLNTALELLPRTIAHGGCDSCGAELFIHFRGERQVPTGPPIETCPVCGHRAEPEEAAHP